MASKIGLSYRNEAARARLGAALEELAERSGEVMVPPPECRRNAGLEATMRLEWMAEVLEAVVAGARARAGVVEERDARIRALEAALAERAVAGGTSKTSRAVKRGE